MAAESHRLAEAHRLAQARLGAETVQLMGRLFPLLDLTDIDGTQQRWLRAAIPVIAAQHRRSARLAADYLSAARRLDLPIDPDWVPRLAAPNVAEFLTSLRVTGPLRVRKLTASGAGLATVRRTALTAVSRSGMRLALSGGRDTITRTLSVDRAGWARVTSGQPCAFCAMLASRGPVYTGEHSAHFPAHDGCACSAMAVYDRADGWTSQAAEFRGLWEETTAGHSGRDAINAFRRAIEGDLVEMFNQAAAA